MVTEDLFESIVTKKVLGTTFGDQILFALEVDFDDIEFTTIRGKIPLVESLEDFEAEFIMNDPPVVRAISL
jgi:hypothetical protein